MLWYSCWQDMVCTCVHSVQVFWPRVRQTFQTQAWESPWTVHMAIEHHSTFLTTTSSDYYTLRLSTGEVKTRKTDISVERAINRIPFPKNDLKFKPLMSRGSVVPSFLRLTHRCVLASTLVLKCCKQLLRYSPGTCWSWVKMDFRDFTVKHRKTITAHQKHPQQTLRIPFDYSSLCIWLNKISLQ